MKKKIFVIVQKELLETQEDIYVVRAASEDDALIQYAKEYFAHDRYIIKEIEDSAINATFWEQFFFPSIYYIENGLPVTDLDYEERKSKLKENIKNYLGEDRHLTLELLDFYYNEDKNMKIYQINSKSA